MAGNAVNSPEANGAGAQPRCSSIAVPNGRHEARFFADVGRALAIARVASRLVDTPADDVLVDAVAIVAFGKQHARAAGARLPAQRQQSMAWVVSGEPAQLLGDALRKRALWSELRRVARTLTTTRARKVPAPRSGVEADRAADAQRAGT